MATTVVGFLESRVSAERVRERLQTSCGCARSQIELTPVGSQHADSASDGHRSRGEHRMSIDRTGDDRANDAMEAAGLGAAVGGVIGLIAALVPFNVPGLNWAIDDGVIPSLLVGAVIGALIGGLMRYMSAEGMAQGRSVGAGHGERADGGTLITVHASSSEAATCAGNLLRAHGAVDVEERGGGHREDRGSGHTQDEQVLPVAEEELAVGKREVSKGGLRVHTRVASVPAEETVELREEHAVLERVKVDRPAALGEEFFKEQTFEVLEMAEEAVVQKRSRVKEEVRIAKQVTQRTETVRDTVRKTEVEVERNYSGTERRINRGPYGGQDRRAELRAV